MQCALVEWYRALRGTVFAPVARNFERFRSGRSVAWLARLFRVQEVVSSNLTAPTISTRFLGLPLRNALYTPLNST